MNLTEIPADLKKLTANEKIDFYVKANNIHPKNKSYFMIIFGMGIIVFISVFVYFFAASRLVAYFKSNDELTLATFESLLFPIFIFGLFVIMGLSIVILGFYNLFRSGGYFVGTETRLIRSLNNKIIITDWKQFSGSIKLNNKNILGDIEFQLKTGKMNRKKDGSENFVPDIIYMSGINNVLEIERLCRIRIKKNDPIPVNVIQ